MADQIKPRTPRPKLTDKDILDAMAKFDKYERYMTNRRLVMVAYHKWNPRYLYRAWRAKRRVSNLNARFEEALAADAPQSAHPKTPKNRKEA